MQEPRAEYFDIQKSIRFRAVVTNVLAAAQVSLLDFFEMGYLPEEAYSSVARFLTRRRSHCGLEADTARVPRRIVEQFAFPIAQRAASVSGRIRRPFTSKEFLQFVTEGSVAEDSSLPEFACPIIFSHNKRQLAEYAKIYGELESRSREIVVLMDDLTYVCSTDETAPAVWRSPTQQAKHPNHACQLAIQRASQCHETRELAAESWQEKTVTVLVTVTCLTRAVSSTGPFGSDAELGDIAIESLIDQATAQEASIGIVDDRPNGNAPEVREWLDRFDSIRMFDQQVVMFRARGSLCRAIFGLKDGINSEAPVIDALRVLSAAMSNTILPMDDLHGLLEFLHALLTYRR